MNLREILRTALDSLLANKLRAILTMMGVIIGVAAVIALLAIGNGVSSSITEEITAIGTNQITISTDLDNSNGYPALSLEDVTALQQAPSVSDVAAIVQGNQEVIAGGDAINATVAGVTANYLALNNLTDFQSGDGLNQNDSDIKARVAVLGSDAAADLFPNEYPIGNTVKINGTGYEVVGVLEASGSSFADSDGNIYIPMSTAQSRLYTTRTRDGDKAVTAITALAANSEVADTAIVEITEILRDQHGIVYAADDDFTIFNQADLLDTANTISSLLSGFLGAIAGISLLVGGIGIMNIMMVSVTERTREIGIRKALGALKANILAQFLSESLVLSLIGGFIGIIFGWLIATVAGNVLGLTAAVELGTVALSVGFAASVGIIFGIYPAWRASNLRPIEALRYE